MNMNTQLIAAHWGMRSAADTHSAGTIRAEA